MYKYNILPKDFLLEVTDISQLPPPNAGVIDLDGNGTIYQILGLIDLGGNELRVSGTNITIVGVNQETTGFINGSINILNQCKCYFLRFDMISTFSISSLTSSYDWNNINFYNCPSISVTNAGFVVWDTIGFINSYGLSFSGEINTFVFENSIFRSVAEPNATFIQFANGLQVNGRIRIETSRFITNSPLQTAIDFGGVTIGDELFIINKTFFQGTGTALNGINGNSIKALLTNNQGGNVINSTRFGRMYMNFNTTPTTIATAGQATKVAGTFTANPNNQRFDFIGVDNVLQDISPVSATYQLQATMSVSAGANKEIGCYLCVCRNGNAINPIFDKLSTSKNYIASATGTRPDSISLIDVVDLSNGDRVYLAVENATDTTAITVEFANLIVQTNTI